MDVTFILDNLLSVVNGLDAGFNLDLGAILGSAGSSGAPVVPEVPVETLVQ